MTSRQIVFVILIAVVILFLILELIRRRMLREKYSLLWVMIAVIMLTIPVLYPYYVKLAAYVGIKSPQSFFFYSAIIGLVLLSLQFSLSISTAYRNRKVMAQQMALLEKRIRDLEQR